MRELLFLAGLLVLPFAAQADGDYYEGDVQGWMHLGVNPEYGHDGLGLILIGPQAVRAFHMMRSKAEPDACTGGHKKTDPSGFWCILDPGGQDASCSFGYDFQSGTFHGGPMIC